MGAPIGYPTAPRYLPDSDQHRRLLGEQAQRQNQGKTNNVIIVTLRSNEATTTITDVRLSPASFLGFMPETANAATALATTYVADTNRLSGSVVINHANNAQTDKTFRVILVG